MLGEQDRAAVPNQTAIGQETSTLDAALVNAARHDPHAFEQLYLRYAERILRYAVGQTGSVATAEDVVSDTMIAAFEQLARFDPDRGTFGAWIFGIARRRLADEHRRTARLWRFFSRQRVEPVAEEDALSRVIRSEQAAKLRVAVGHLSKRDREIILLRYVAELSGPEIGEILGLSPGTVRVRLHRAIRRLATELGDDDVVR